MRARLLFQSGLLGLFITASLHAAADELIKWERIPLQIPLKVGQERVIFADKNVRVGFPPALNDKLRVQSTGGAVYLKADSAFPQTRLQLQDLESGEIILLDVTASPSGPTEPVRLVYSGDVTTVDNSDRPAKVSGRSDSSSTTGAKPDTKEPKAPRYNAPLPVALTRFAAQTLYGPLRAVEPVSGIHPVNPRLSGKITTLYPSEPLDITTLSAWGVGARSVVALRVRNTSSRKIVLDPRVLQGQFVSATFQHRWVGPIGTPEDTTTLYLITDSRPELAFVAEPVAKMPPTSGKASKKDRVHAN
ncbi:TIGR03749 family integrating conjugative element protein [Pectobacterium brasiliense]|uniref:TIGR03749 family integrating conjugative element protein n=1 Tax=Pectobacterium brasiliense TaxID=180957 RepID=UPI0015DE8721|nr:TIGR03749 family integrating conjugative element protein [Pectobacterium brasiliense]MBA0218668.1 TIGR03749 family integrating conjugative element protein [Pectobacterium brasiliense]